MEIAPLHTLPLRAVINEIFRVLNTYSESFAHAEKDNVATHRLALCFYDRFNATRANVTCNDGCFWFQHISGFKHTSGLALMGAHPEY